MVIIETATISEYSNSVVKCRASPKLTMINENSPICAMLKPIRVELIIV